MSTVTMVAGEILHQRAINDDQIDCRGCIKLPCRTVGSEENEK